MTKGGTPSFERLHSQNCGFGWCPASSLSLGVLHDFLVANSSLRMLQIQQTLEPQQGLSKHVGVVCMASASRNQSSQWGCNVVDSSKKPASIEGFGSPKITSHQMLVVNRWFTPTSAKRSGTCAHPMNPNPRPTNHQNRCHTPHVAHRHFLHAGLWRRPPLFGAGPVIFAGPVFGAQSNVSLC